MTGDNAGSGDQAARRSAERARRRRLAEVFGDVLPETTSDERSGDATERGKDSASDHWHRENRPPHHDR